MFYEGESVPLQMNHSHATFKDRERKKMWTVDHESIMDDLCVCLWVSIVLSANWHNEYGKKSWGKQ